MRYKSIFKRLTVLFIVCIMTFVSMPSAAALTLERGPLPDYEDGEYDDTLPRVIDEADLLSSTEVHRLEDRIQDIIDEYEFDCVILTVDDYRMFGYSNIQNFADDFFDYKGYGIGSGYDGIILVVSMDDRSYSFSTCGYGMVAISDSYGIGWIEDDVIGYLSDKEYYKCFDKFTDDVYDFVKEAKENKPYSSGHLKYSAKRFFSNWFAAMMCSLIITVVAVSLLIGQMKTIIPKPAAKPYLKWYKEKYAQDTFLYANVTKVRRDSGGSGGGGGGHIGSSGRSHGGSSGHF